MVEPHDVVLKKIAFEDKNIEFLKKEKKKKTHTISVNFSKLNKESKHSTITSLLETNCDKKQHTHSDTRSLSLCRAYNSDRVKSPVFSKQNKTKIRVTFGNKIIFL